MFVAASKSLPVILKVHVRYYLLEEPRSCTTATRPLTTDTITATMSVVIMAMVLMLLVVMPTIIIAMYVLVGLSEAEVHSNAAALQ